MRIALSLFLAGLATVCLNCASPQTEGVEEEPAFATRFQEAGVVGTFVLFNPGDNIYRVHNEERTRKRYTPASTFKVLNSLIALETRVVADTNSTFVWDGTERSIPQWNRDHTLATAYRNSAVWVYQDLARRIGQERMSAFVDTVDYGNENISGDINMFWLDGGLEISAMEQVNFLQQLHERRLPFSDRTFDLVEGMMIEDQQADYVLHAKSGWGDSMPADIGWFVGYVVRGDDTFYFALNLDIEAPEQGAFRRSVARAILADEGLM